MSGTKALWWSHDQHDSLALTYWDNLTEAALSNKSANHSC